MTYEKGYSILRELLSHEEWANFERNMYNDYYYSEKLRRNGRICYPHMIIDFGFLWVASNEGQEYWNQIYSRLSKIDYSDYKSFYPVRSLKRHKLVSYES